MPSTPEYQPRHCFIIERIKNELLFSSNPPHIIHMRSCKLIWVLSGIRESDADSVPKELLQWSLCREMMRALILSLSSTQLQHGILPHLGPSEPSHSTAALPWWGGSSDSWGEGKDVQIITSHLNRVEAKQDWATATRRSSRVQYQHYAQGCKSLGYCSAWPTQISASGIWKYAGTIFFQRSCEKGQACRNPNVNSWCSSVGLQCHIKGWQNTPEAAKSLCPGASCVSPSTNFCNSHPRSQELHMRERTECIYNRLCKGAWRIYFAFFLKETSPLK